MEDGLEERRFRVIRGCAPLSSYFLIRGDRGFVVRQDGSEHEIKSPDNLMYALSQESWGNWKEIRTTAAISATRSAVIALLSLGYSWSDIAEALCLEHGEAEAIAYYLNLILAEIDDMISRVVSEAILSNPKIVEDFRKGKQAALGALIGTIKKRHGNIDSRKVKEEIQKQLNKEQK